MAKKKITLTWTAKIAGKDYGDAVEIELRKGDDPARKDIASAVRVIAEQMTMSLQKIVTGTSDQEIRVGKIKHEAEKILKGKPL